MARFDPRMSLLNKTVILLLSVILTAGIVSADIPPDPGFRRVSQNLVLDPQDEFAEYRFFIRSGADLKEIVFKKGERQVIEPLGGGAWYRSGILVAVPRKSLDGLGQTPIDGKLSEMEKAVYDGKVAGIVELIKHTFSRDVREVEASKLSHPAYRIEKDVEKGLRATLVTGSSESKADANPDFSIYSNEVKTPLFWATVIGGSLMTLAFISLGVWYVRRSKIV